MATNSSDPKTNPPISSTHRRYSNPADNNKEKETTEGEEGQELDQYEVSLRKSGCSEQHYQLQECYFNNGNDWRKCQHEIKLFKDCMSSEQRKKSH